MSELLDDEAREKAAAALIAYNAMETTKRRHFDYLSMLESKRKKFNLDATPEETALLGALLQDHDYAVKTFKAQAQVLQSESPESHRSLFRYIGLLNQIFSDSNEAMESSH